MLKSQCQCCHSFFDTVIIVFFIILQQCAMRIRNFIVSMDAIEMMILNAGKINAYQRIGSMMVELTVTTDLMSVSKVLATHDTPRSLDLCLVRLCDQNSFG